jgi:hypothetical protein
MTESVKKVVFIAVGTAILVSAIVINLYVLDVVIFRDVQETLGKVLSVIGISTVAVVAVMLLAQAAGRR